MKKKGKLLVMLILIFAVTFGETTYVNAAVPGLSNSRYMKTYVLSTGNNTYIYTDQSLRTRGTSSPYRAYNACIYAADEVYVYSMNDTCSYVSYPTSSGRKYGYIKTSSITSNNYSRSTQKSSAKITTYRRAGSKSYGSIAKGDGSAVAHTIVTLIQPVQIYHRGVLIV